MLRRGAAGDYGLYEASCGFQVDLAARDFVLKCGGELVDVGRSDVYRHAVEQRGAIAAHGVAADLNQQALHHVGIILYRAPCGPDR